MRHGVRDGLPKRLFRQLRPFLPPHAPDDELHVDLRQDPRHRVVDHRGHIAVEVPPIENPHLLHAQEQGARHVRGHREPAHVARRQPGAGERHPVFAVQQAEVPERHHRLHRFRNLGAAGEPRPDFVVEVLLDGIPRAGLPVEMQAPGIVEQIFDLRVRHLLAAGAVAQKEPPPERVGLAFLRRHDDAQHVAGALDLHFDRRVRRPRGALHLRLHPVVVRHADDLPGVGNADQDGSAPRVGECAQLAAEVLRQRALELDRCAFPAREEVGDVRSSVPGHAAISPPIRHGRSRSRATVSRLQGEGIKAGNCRPGPTGCQPALVGPPVRDGDAEPRGPHRCRGRPPSGRLHRGRRHRLPPPKPVTPPRGTPPAPAPTTHDRIRLQ